MMHRVEMDVPDRHPEKKCIYFAGFTSSEKTCNFLTGFTYSMLFNKIACYA
jgi:hypothetical protein